MDGVDDSVISYILSSGKYTNFFRISISCTFIVLSVLSKCLLNVTKSVTNVLNFTLLRLLLRLWSRILLLVEASPFVSLHDLAYSRAEDHVVGNITSYFDIAII